MKTVLYVLCCFTMIVVLAGCRNGDDGGSSGGPGDWPTVSFTVDANDNVTCFGADTNAITTRQTCVWNCAYYNSSKPRYVQLWFDEAPVCIPTGELDEDDDPVLECNVEVALVREIFQPCKLGNARPF